MYLGIEKLHADAQDNTSFEGVLLLSGKKLLRHKTIYLLDFHLILSRIGGQQPQLRINDGVGGGIFKEHSSPLRKTFLPRTVVTFFPKRLVSVKVLKNEVYTCIR